jgi:hypothetical protein
MFSLTVFFLALGITAATALPTLDNPVGITAVSLGALALGIGIHLLMHRLAQDALSQVTAIRLVLTLSILGWAALMTGQLANIPFLEDAKVLIPAYGWLPAWIPLEFNLLVVFQIPVVLLGIVLSLVTLRTVQTRLHSPTARFAGRLVIVFLIVYAAGAVFLLTR